MFFDFLMYPKFKGGTLTKCLISNLSNLAETFTGKKNSKISNEPKFKVPNSKKSVTIGFPEGLENKYFFVTFSKLKFVRLACAKK